MYSFVVIKTFIYLLFFSNYFFYDFLYLGKSTKFRVFFTQLECVLYCTMFEMNEPLCSHNINYFVESGGEETNMFLGTGIGVIYRFCLGLFGL